MADELRRRMTERRARLYQERKYREWLENQRTMLIEQIVRREAELEKVVQAVDVLRSTIERFTFEIAMYRENLEEIQDDLAEYERAELHELEMGTESDRFVGMTIANAAYEVLKEAGRAMHVAEISGALIRGGLRSRAQRPTLSITTALLRDKTRFKRVAPNTYALVETQPRLIDES